MGEVGREDNWAERSLRKLIEGFSLFTAASFVISGFFNALIFWARFRMNYFDIAQPSDIVMSGFLYVSFVLALTVIIILPIYANRFVVQTVFPWFVDRLSRRIETKDEDAARKLRDQFSNTELFRNAFKWVNLAMAMLTVATAVVSIFVAPKNPKVFGPPPAPPPFWEQPLPTAAVSNLYLSNSDGQFAACGRAPVLWMGWHRCSSIAMGGLGLSRILKI
jgi:hypothetical protein